MASNMTVSEMAKVMAELVEAGYGDRELRFAYQENYPLQDTVQGIWFSDCEQVDEDGNMLEGEQAEQASEDGGFIYIVSYGQDRDDPYAPRAAFTSCIRDL